MYNPDYWQNAKHFLKKALKATGVHSESWHEPKHFSNIYSIECYGCQLWQLAESKAFL